MTTSRPAKRSVIIERETPHSPDKVWRALTEPALIERWLMKNDFQPMVGHTFHFRAEPRPHWNGVLDCEVLVVRPRQRLSYTWNTSGEEAASGLKTVVTWTLTPTEAGVRVRLEQSGFRRGEEQGASHGWPRLIDTLERVVKGLV